MSVSPGFGGQQFIPSSLEKIKRIRNMMAASRSLALLEVDGGVNLNNVASVIKAGANVLVAGSAIFGSSDIPETIRQMRSASQTVIV
jgi:ribulose-phosphate 3-epimerase